MKNKLNENSWVKELKEKIAPPFGEWWVDDGCGEYHFDEDALVDFIQSEIDQALDSQREQVESLIDEMWIDKEKDKDGHDVGWNSALEELSGWLKIWGKKGGQHFIR